MKCNFRIVPGCRLARIARAGGMLGTGAAMRIGDIARLNTGGPELLVVDVDGETITAASLVRR